MPEPIEEASRNTPTFRDDLTPPEPIPWRLGADSPWDFAPPPTYLRWIGEGDRCAATFPPGELERSVRCELRDGHLQEWPHSAQRSSV